MQYRAKHRGFTLIELLVVIAIIAVLAAMLFPVFMTARERGRVATCISNMRQIGTAMQHYVDEHEGAYPDQSVCGHPYGVPYTDWEGTTWIQDFSHRCRTNDGGKPAGMGKILFRHLKNLSVFKCPSEYKSRSETSWGIPYEAASSYYIKHAMCAYANFHEHPLTLSAAKYASKATLMYEEAWHGPERPFLWDVGSYPDATRRPPHKRVGAIFVDCHVGYIKVPFHPTSGYDGNWYWYLSSPVITELRYWDISTGARDIY